MSKIRLLEAAEIVLANYGTITITEDRTGDFKILITPAARYDSEPARVWLGFQDEHGVHYFYFDQVHKQMVVRTEKG